MRSGGRWWGLEFSHLQIAGFTLHTFFSSQCQFYLSIILTIFKVVRRLSRSLGYFHYLSIYTLRKISLPFPRIEEGYLRHCSLYVNSKSRKKNTVYSFSKICFCVISILFKLDNYFISWHRIKHTFLVFIDLKDNTEALKHVS